MKTKNRIWSYSLIVMGLIVMFTNSCEKDIVETTVKDIDGNIYNTIKIGDQTWMVENLKTTKLNDGTNIPNVTDDNEWYALSTPGYCWYDNQFTNNATYGALYNGYAVNTGKLAPIGWHVPTEANWSQLTDYLGGKLVAADKLKEIGTTHWQTPNEGATNETGFTALPGGICTSSGTFRSVGVFGFWWSATEYDSNNIWNYNMVYSTSCVSSNYLGKGAGFSVRCVKD
jgi:uncharacterized protein (TIGR02145 family)